jgi:molybdenum cofactor biosynthesis enzyme MoaA
MEEKNRDREPFSFANINLLGKCNANCFFCLGKDIEKELAPHNQMKTHFSEWKNFQSFLSKCHRFAINKIYITGQNTDSLLYPDLAELIQYLQEGNFRVGLRTNGYLALNKLKTLNLCDLSIGYSIHTLEPMTNKMILNRSDIPDWKTIIPATKNCRVQIVVNRCNRYDFWHTLRFIASFPNVKYIQVRRVSTETRTEQLAPDVAAYEQLYTEVSKIFPIKKRIWGDAEVYEIYGKDVVFWRTIKTTVNSINYFTDGTISLKYFIVEGYLSENSQSKG